MKKLVTYFYTKIAMMLNSFYYSLIFRDFNLLSKILLSIIVLMMGGLITGCIFTYPSYPFFQDVEEFRDTSAWELALAIYDDDPDRIMELLTNDTSLINYKEKRYHHSPLQMAAGLAKPKATENLLNFGADPNHHSKNGFFPILDAIENSWSITVDGITKIQGDDDNSRKTLNILLDHGADPNNKFEPEKNTPPFEGCLADNPSSLIFALDSRCDFEMVKMLVEHGADINYKTPSGMTASIKALQGNYIYIAHYLIVQNDADISGVYYDLKSERRGPFVSNEIDFSNPQYPVDLLLDLVYEDGTPEKRMKDEIIKTFMDKGIDYHKRKDRIPSEILNLIKSTHPSDWEEYVRTY